MIIIIIGFADSVAKIGGGRSVYMREGSLLNISCTIQGQVGIVIIDINTTIIIVIIIIIVIVSLSPSSSSFVGESCPRDLVVSRQAPFKQLWEGGHQYHNRQGDD